MFNGTELVFLTCLCAWAVQSTPTWVAAFAVGTSALQTFHLFHGFYQSRKKAAILRNMMPSANGGEKINVEKIEEDLSAMLKLVEEIKEKKSNP